MVFLFKLPRMLPVAVFLLLGLTSVSASAAEPTPEQQEIIDAIKNYAERHVDRNEPSNPERVFDLYENNEVGLSLPEIAKIYEDEFDRLKAEVKPSFWEQIQPNLGWAAAVFFAVLAIFGNALKGILKDAVNKLKEKLYIKFAGSRLMRRKALRRYREALIERYGEVDIAFRPNKPLAMADLFVPLKVSDRPDSEQIDADEALHQHRRLMIKGDPGSGKSMLLRHLAFAFANDDLFLEDDPIPVLLELHRLSESDKSIADHLVDVFKRNDFPNAGTFVRQALSRGGLLLLFDGLDEVASARRNAVVKQLRDFLDTNKCRALITCRTAVYRGDFDADVDASLQMVEFSDQQITRFLGAWAPQMPAHKSIDQLMGTLRDRPRIMGLARNPLLLTIVAYLYTDTPEELPRSRAGFYELATNILIGQWHKDHNRYEARDKLAVLRKLARFNQETETIQDHDRRSIAFQDVLKEVKDVLPDLNLNPEIDTTKIVHEIVERSGLLLAIDAGERYQFAHLTLQEFLVASALRDAPENLLQFYQMDPDGWREPVKLWCGLANDSTHIIKTVYGIDPLTSLECLVETKSVDGDLAEEIIETFKEQLNKPKPQSGVLRALGGISADRRPRGKEVFAFLTNCLKECQPDSSRFKNAARALSFSNLPKAALHLGERYIEETREHLIRMGDLAVPCLESLATKGNPNAIEDLGTIGTPRAAKALVPLLWHDADTVSLPAAWQLTRLLPIEAVEDELRDVPLTENQRKAPGLDWIWAPFEEPADSSLPIVTGRIGFHLKNLAEGKILFGLPGKRNEIDQPDQRILIPVLAATRTNDASDDDCQRFFLDHLSTELRNRLADCFAAIQEFDPRDWKTLFQPSDYEFRGSIHFWLMWGVGSLFFTMSVIEVGTRFWNSSDWIILSNAGLLAISLLLLLDISYLLLVFSSSDEIEDIIALVFLIPCIIFIYEDYERNMDGISIVGSIFIFIKCISSFILSLIFIFRFFSWEQTLSFCIILSFIASLFYLLSRRAKRRAENPIRGLLELPASRRVRRNSSSWFGWIGDGLMSTLRRNRAA